MRKLAVLLAVLFALIVPLTVDAQEGEATPEPANVLDINENFYNNPSGWHVFIPAGWIDESTVDYARFTNDTRLIYVREYPGSDAESAAAQILADTGLTSIGAPIDQRDLQLSNGTWTQFLYANEDARAVVHTQEYQGTRYAMVYSTADLTAIPLIVMREGALEDPSLIADGMIEATRLIVPTVTTPITSENVIQGVSTITIQTFDGGITAIGRVRGSAIYTVAGTGDTDTFNSASGYFNVLNDFFLTPRTQPYLFLGLGLAFGIMTLLLLSLFFRWRSLLRDEAALRELENP